MVSSNLKKWAKLYEKFVKMKLRSSVRGTRCTEAEGVSLGRDYNRDPDRYRANSIINSDANDAHLNMENENLYDVGNGSTSHIFRCRSKRCLFQKKFFPQDRIVSTTTNRIYNCIVPPGTTYLNDHSSNVIYLITCNKCKLQYVGETCLKLNERFNIHNSSLRNPSNSSFCKILNNHFTKGLCKGSSYSVSLIEKLEGTGQTDRGFMDPKQTPARKLREVFWMKELRTIFPYGLNDRIGDEPKTADSHINVGLKFRSLPRKHKRVGRGKSHNGICRTNPVDFITTFKQMLEIDLVNVPNFLRTSLCNMKKSGLKSTYLNLNDLLSSDSSLTLYKQYFQQCLDIIDCKLYKPRVPKSRKKPPENVCNIFFDNKGVEFINLARILRDPDVISSLPNMPKKFSTPMVTYKLGLPISSKIFNFNKFVNSLNLDDFLANPNILPCECENSPFSDKNHKHIITGDLRLVSNNTLRKIFSRGPKFREHKAIDLSKAKSCILDGLEDCIENFSSKHGYHKTAFAEWINNIKLKIDDRIQVLKNSLHTYYNDDSLSSPSVKNALNDIHTKYVVVPIDKATGNIALICKRFYATVIVKELGLGPNNTSSTYDKVNDRNIECIISSNIKDLKSKFDINGISADNQCLPNMYWLPKMHKNPIKARFIIGSSKSSIKPLSKAITSAFRLFYRQIENYNDKLRFYTGVNTFWVVQNNKPVIDAMKKLNARNKAKSISTFDFSTLYTKLPHNKLLHVLNKLIDFCYNGGPHKFVTITKYGARWTKDKSEHNISFDIKMMKDAVAYLLSNCFFTIGSKIFRQVIGIPMGSDPAPFFANLFLYYFEHNWMNQIKKNDLIRARKMCYLFRFIDDLSAINDGGDFENNFKDIYPEELQLGKENQNSSEASFLDLSIQIHNNKFSVGLYDKRDSFPFNIVRMPYKSSNLPSNIFYSAIGAETLRIARASNSTDSFYSAVKPLVIRMHKQGARSDRLLKVFKKFFYRHENDFKDIVGNPQELLALLLD